MSNYYVGKSLEEYEEDYEGSSILDFGDKLEEGIYASLPSLEGVVELGKGKDTLEAKEDYLEKIEFLIQELKEKKLKVEYDLVGLDYTTVKGI